MLIIIHKTLKKMETKNKESNPYKVRTFTKAVKDADMESRTVTGVFNSYFYIDSDLDMLLPGCAAKSIQERGVGSTKGNRIKHLKDHDWNKNIARIDVLDERKVSINGMSMDAMYHESFYPAAQDSTDQLIKVLSGLYDARSIGFQYEKIVKCAKDSNVEDEVKNWNKYLPMAINSEVAEKEGYFWTVKEIKLWEGSDVSFGANELTPMLGMKSASKDLIIKQAFGKLDICMDLFKNGNLSDEGFHTLEMEMKQIKSYISSISEQQPLKKDTIHDSRPVEDTSSKDFLIALLT